MFSKKFQIPLVVQNPLPILIWPPYYYIYFFAQRKRWWIGGIIFCSFRALQSLEKAVRLQEEVLDTHDELIHTHQAMSIVLKGLGREEEAEWEMELAGQCAKRLDSVEVPLEIFQTSEEMGWVVSDSVPISSSPGHVKSMTWKVEITWRAPIYWRTLNRMIRTEVLPVALVLENNNGLGHQIKTGLGHAKSNIVVKNVEMMACFNA